MPRGRDNEARGRLNDLLEGAAREEAATPEEELANEGPQEVRGLGYYINAESTRAAQNVRIEELAAMPVAFGHTSRPRRSPMPYDTSRLEYTVVYEHDQHARGPLLRVNGMGYWESTIRNHYDVRPGHGFACGLNAGQLWDLLRRFQARRLDRLVYDEDHPSGPVIRTSEDGAFTEAYLRERVAATANGHPSIQRTEGGYTYQELYDAIRRRGRRLEDEMPSNHERIDGDVIYLRDHMYSLSGIRRVAEESPNFTLSNGMEVAEAAAIADRLQGVAPPPPPPVQQRPQAEEGEVPPGPWRADYRREEVPGVDLHLAVMPQWLRHVSIGPRLPVSGSYTLPSQQLRGAVLRVFKRAAEGGNEVAAPIVQRLENGAMVMWIPKKVDELGRWLPGTGFNNRA